uniref:C2H2-type domain-containing protein n=1 Tax=Tetranychus urticae TaxID=32264 RepID=T1KIW7_TETUR
MSSQFIPSPLDVLAEASVQRLAEEREKAKFDPSSVFYGLGQSPSFSYQPSTSSDDAMDITSDADDSQLLDSSFCEYQQSFLHDVWETSDDDIFKSDPSSVFDVPEQSPSSSYQPSTLNDEGMNTTSDSDDIQDLESSFCEYKQSFLYDIYGTSDDDSLDSSFSCKSDITSDLEVHGISHTYKERRRIKIYICEECGYTTNQPESYYPHVKQNHPDSHVLEKSYDFGTSDDSSLDSTFSSCKSDITSDLEVNSISHTYKERRRIKKIFICEACGNRTNEPELHYLHLLQNHPYSPALEEFFD